jgi:hypothetical protein
VAALSVAANEEAEGGAELAHPMHLEVLAALDAGRPPCQGVTTATS